MEDQYILETNGIGKHFSGVKALTDINIKIKRGEVHAFLGENGAGKSTLVKIISGGYTATEGSFTFNGREITHFSPREAQHMGIAIVHQELNLFPELSVTENIFLGREQVGPLGRVKWTQMHAEAEKLLAGFDLHFDVRSKIGDLSIAEQQMVEIVKSMSMNAELIILDEPTDVLTERETEQLFTMIRRLQKEGKTVIYISHRLDELRHVCDRFSVFRDGRHVYTGPVADHTKDEIVQMMVARKLTEQYPRVETPGGAVVLSASHICRGRPVQDISFEARAGEILGFYGLVGSGRTELMRAIVGADKKTGGEVKLNGAPLHISQPGQALQNGIVYITESRKEDGLMLDMPVSFNCSIAVLNECLNIARGIDARKEEQLVDQAVQSLSIKTPSNQQLVRKLSGGNQQKVLLARYILTKPRVLIVDEPTRGVDVGAKVSIYQILNQLKEAGVAIIMVSSDMPEIMGISDRVMVMYAGKITGRFAREELSEQAVAACAFGKTRESETIG